MIKNMGKIFTWKTEGKHIFEKLKYIYIYISTIHR